MYMIYIYVLNIYIYVNTYIESSSSYMKTVLKYI